MTSKPRYLRPQVSVLINYTRIIGVNEDDPRKFRICCTPISYSTLHASLMISQMHHDVLPSSLIMLLPLIKSQPSPCSSVHPYDKFASNPSSSEAISVHHCAQHVTIRCTRGMGFVQRCPVNKWMEIHSMHLELWVIYLKILNLSGLCERIF